MAAGVAALVVAVAGIHHLWRGRALRRPRGTVPGGCITGRSATSPPRSPALTSPEPTRWPAGPSAATLARPQGDTGRRPRRGTTRTSCPAPGSTPPAQLRRGEGLAAWCRTVRRVPGPSGDILVVGRYHRLQLKLLSRRWLGHGGLRVQRGRPGLGGRRAADPATRTRRCSSPGTTARRCPAGAAAPGAPRRSAPPRSRPRRASRSAGRRSGPPRPASTTGRWRRCWR